jgi:hypothetical protein
MMGDSKRILSYAGNEASVDIMDNDRIAEPAHNPHSRLE